LTASSYCKTVR